MPVYIYRCNCGIKEDILRSVDERNNPLLCKCGLSMERVYSPFSINMVTVPITGRAKMINNLNHEDGYRFPAKYPKDIKRIENALAQGIYPERRVVGVGF